MATFRLEGSRSESAPRRPSASDSARCWFAPGKATRFALINLIDSAMVELIQGRWRPQGHRYLARIINHDDRVERHQAVTA